MKPSKRYWFGSSALLAAGLLFAGPAMAAKLHLMNCTNATVDARVYNSYDSVEGVAASIKNIDGQASDDNTATLKCGTKRCRLKIDSHNVGKHPTGHYTITSSAGEFNISEDVGWECPG